MLKTPARRGFLLLPIPMISLSLLIKNEPTVTSAAIRFATALAVLMRVCIASFSMVKVCFTPRAQKSGFGLTGRAR